MNSASFVPCIMLINGIITPHVTTAVIRSANISEDTYVSTSGFSSCMPNQYIIYMTTEQMSVLDNTFLMYFDQSSSLSLLLRSSEVFFLMNTHSLSGSFSSRNLYTLAEFLMNRGVVNVVITDTHTTTGYRKSLITPRLDPSVAMIKENSPI